MPVNFPSELEVQCDTCGQSVMMEVTDYVGGTCGVHASTFEDLGWKWHGPQTCYCPDCKNGDDE